MAPTAAQGQPRGRLRGDDFEIAGKRITAPVTLFYALDSTENSTVSD